MAVATDTFLYGIIVPVILFALSSRVGVAQYSVQSWTSILLAVYGAALLVCSPFAGFYADRSSSRRLPLLGGLLALAGATLMLCLARSVSLLVLGRILQGASASIVWTVGFALLVDTVGQAEIGKTLGWTNISMSVSILSSPLLGGVVYQRAGYYSVYYMAFGLIALDILFRLLLIEKKIARQWLAEEAPKSDYPSSPEQGNDPEEKKQERRSLGKSFRKMSTHLKYRSNLRLLGHPANILQSSLSSNLAVCWQHFGAVSSKCLR
jgi:MFS family permease